VKTETVYALWSPTNNDIALWSFYSTRDEALECCNFPAYQRWGYRVIPVTISYEPPKPAKLRKKGAK
jgi:hypothetical protein